MPTHDSDYRLRCSLPTLAIVGATGAVGTEFLNILAQRRFPVGGLRVFASPRSAGKTLIFNGHDIAIETLSEDAFAGVDLALFSAGSGTAREWAPIAMRQRAIVVDNSSAFRMNQAVPLVVPEINVAEISRHQGHPRAAELRSDHRDHPALAELVAATRAHLAGDPYTPRVLLHPYAFNLFSHNTPINPATGCNEAETKVVNETRKIFGDPDIRIGVTCVRVPVQRAHCAAITIECQRPIDPDAARADRRRAGLPDCRRPSRQPFPDACRGHWVDDILVGRIRRDLSDPSGHSLSLFIAGDQLRKGAALNAVQIAEHLL